eukprot:TRINITY_DN989_c0_g1_i2.p2 TRINITY_DN989_c0_g1~~TRINITY_DN989_c0_g1_i2.p2  ORF type:complete len:143 (-),score=49.01 TRINITY_DN989_c0_g1_i2:122-550(-)
MAEDGDGDESFQVVVTNGLLRAMVAPPAKVVTSTGSSQGASGAGGGAAPPRSPPSSGASPAKQPRVSPAMIAAAAETAAADSLAKAVERAAAKLPPTEGKRSTDLPCGAERAATLACYKSGGDVLQCGAVVDAFAACAARLL